MRFPIVSAAALLVVVAGCGGSSSSNPTAPSGGGGASGGGASAATIAIVGERGSQSFSPNPASVTQGASFAWKNNDGVTHHIVMNDGSLDTGDIRPGASSAALTLATNGGNYHCTIHPTMVGSINSASGTPPPCSGPYCDSSK